MISCGSSSASPAAGIEVLIQPDLEILLLGAGAVIGEIEALLDQRIDVDRPVLARALARMQQHVLDDGVGALAVLHHFFEIALQHRCQFVGFLRASCRRAAPASARRPAHRSTPTESAEKLLMKLSGFLISCAMPAVSWPSEASFSVWIRRSCAARNSSSDVRQFAGARFNLFEQADILDRDRRLVGECRSELDLLVGERPHLGARQTYHADRHALAQHRHAEHGAVIRRSSCPSIKV